MPQRIKKDRPIAECQKQVKQKELGTFHLVAPKRRPTKNITANTPFKKGGHGNFGSEVIILAETIL